MPNSGNRINYFKSKRTVQLDGEGELWHFLVGVLKLGGCVHVVLSIGRHGFELMLL